MTDRNSTSLQANTYLNGRFAHNEKEERYQARQQEGVDEEEVLVVLTAQQVQELQSGEVKWLPVKIWIAQMAVAAALVLVVLALSAFWGKIPVQAWKSTAYGAFCVLFPSAAMTWIWFRTRHTASAAVALGAWGLAEFAKLFMTLVLLFFAHRFLGTVHWLALFVGFIGTLKAAWIALVSSSLKSKDKVVQNPR